MANCCKGKDRPLVTGCVMCDKPVYLSMDERIAIRALEMNQIQKVREAREAHFSADNFIYQIEP